MLDMGFEVRKSWETHPKVFRAMSRTDFWKNHPCELHEYVSSFYIISGHEPGRSLENPSIFGWVFQTFGLGHDPILIKTEQVVIKLAWIFQLSVRPMPGNLSIGSTSDPRTRTNFIFSHKSVVLSNKIRSRLKLIVRHLCFRPLSQNKFKLLLPIF